MQVSVSIKSIFGKDNFQKISQLIDQSSIDYIHLDFLNEEDEAMVKYCKQKLTKPLDIHFVGESCIHAQRIIDTYQPEIATIQMEDLNGIIPQLSYKGKLGLGVKVSSTLVSIPPSYFGLFNFILCTSNSPGYGGEAFDMKNINKMAWLEENYPRIGIHLDGGINEHSIKHIPLKKVDLLVSGSYVLSHDDYDVAIRILKGIKSV